MGYTRADQLDYYLAFAEDRRIILDPAEAKRFLLDECPEVAALDFETTGLSPLTAEVRLTCIYHPTVGCVILDHFFCGSFNDMIDYYLDHEWIVYNAKFETRWFDYADGGAEEHLITDVDFLAKAKLGGYASSFARMCQRDLSVDIDKTLQTSDWSIEYLTDDQYTYGGLDAVLTWYLYDYWMDELTDEQLEASEIWQDVVRPTIECEDTGLFLDVLYHMQNIKLWKEKQRVALATIRRMVPKSTLDNLNSNKQVSDFIKSQLDKPSLAAWPVTGKREYLSLERKVIGPIAAKAPYPFSRWLNAFMLYRYYGKYLSTYGESLLFKQHTAGKVLSRFNIAQAGTGRFSSANTNLQNIPRKPYVREAFYCPPDLGLCMVLADYKGIEIRTLAQITGDPTLLKDAIYGDVHSSSAATIFHIDEELFLSVVEDKTHPKYLYYKGLRTIAKGFTFQLLYGAGPEALSLVLKCSVDEAAEAIRKWANRYPQAYHYRNLIFDTMNQTGFINVVTGRTIYVRRADRSIPVAANYGVQGAAGDVICRAMHHVRRLNREHQTGALLAANVHDELLEYCPIDRAEEAKFDLETGMRLGWLDVFPDSNTDNLVDSAIGMSWAAKP